jgi:hypothetical protein
LGSHFHTEILVVPALLWPNFVSSLWGSQNFVSGQKEELFDVIFVTFSTTTKMREGCLCRQNISFSPG